MTLPIWGFRGLDVVQIGTHTHTHTHRRGKCWKVPIAGPRYCSPELLYSNIVQSRLSNQDEFDRCVEESVSFSVGRCEGPCSRFVW
jgi:hypothetical protein